MYTPLILETLLALPTTGASTATAKQDGLNMSGLAASAAMAATDTKWLCRNLAAQSFVLKPAITAARDLGIPWQLLLAIASRETRLGAVLKDDWLGDNGNGYGLMQVDKRYHKLSGLSATNLAEKSYLNYIQGGKILLEYRQTLEAAYKNNPLVWRYVIAAYNCGLDGNWPRFSDVDMYTTGKDYSADVLGRLRYITSDFELFKLATQ